MEKFIPFEKLSKKKQRELTAQKRGTWGGMNPVTRKAEKPKAYNRKKARKWSEDSMTVSSIFGGMGQAYDKQAPAPCIAAPEAFALIRYSAPV